MTIVEDTVLADRPLLARGAVKVTLDPDQMADAAGEWTKARYTTDPQTGHAKVDQPAGLDA